MYKKSIQKGLEGSAFFLAVISAISLTLILITIVVSVILRKFFNHPLFFAEELVGLLMNATLFLALPMATLKSQHIHVSLFIDTLKQRLPWLVKPVLCLGFAIGMLFMGWIFWEAIPWMEFAIKRELKSETARILLYPLMAVVPISIGFCGLIYCAQLLGIKEEGDKPV